MTMTKAISVRLYKESNILLKHLKMTDGGNVNNMINEAVIDYLSRKLCVDGWRLLAYARNIAPDEF